MRSDWEELPRGDVQTHFAGIYVSLSARGAISIARRAHEMLGRPTAFVILFDKVNRRIGLRPAPRSTQNAYPVFSTGKHGGYRLNGARLLKEHRIELESTVQFPDAEIDSDGVLILDLRTAKPSPQGRKTAYS